MQKLKVEVTTKHYAQQQNGQSDQQQPAIFQDEFHSPTSKTSQINLKRIANNKGDQSQSERNFIGTGHSGSDRETSFQNPFLKTTPKLYKNTTTLNQDSAKLEIQDIGQADPRDILNKITLQKSEQADTQPVNMEHSMLKIANEDTEQVRELKQAILQQREVLERKTQTYLAVQKNFKILKMLCRQQQQESKECMEHTVRMERENQHIKLEYALIQDQLDSIRDEIVMLRKKEKMYNEANADMLEMKVQLEETELKYRKKFDDFLKKEQENVVLDAENVTLKGEIVTAQKIITTLTEKVTSLHLVNEKNFQRISEQMNTVDSQKTSIRQLEIQLNDLTLFGNELQDANSKQSGIINDLEAERKQANEKIAQQEVELHGLKLNMDSLTVQLNKKIKQAATLSKSLDELKEKHQTLIQSSSKTIQEQTDLIEKQAKKLKKLEAKNIELDERLKSECEVRLEEKTIFAEEKSKLDTRTAALTQEISAMRKIQQMMNMQQSRARVENKNALDENANLYESQIKDKGLAIDGLKEEISQLLEKIGKLEKDLASSNEECEKINKNMIRATQSIEKHEKHQHQLNKVIQQRDEEIESLKQDYATLNKNIDTTVAEKSHQVQKKLDKAEKEIIRLQTELANLTKSYEKKKSQLEDCQIKSQDIQETLDKTIVIDQRLKFEVEYLTKDILAQKRAAAERLLELDQLYQENDVLKDRVNQFMTQFDVQQIEKNQTTLERFDLWGNQVTKWSEKFFLMLKDKFQCCLCQGQAVRLTTLRCEDVFCGDCLVKNQARHECPACFADKKDPIQNKFAMHLIEAIEPLKLQNAVLMEDFEFIQKSVPDNMILLNNRKRSSTMSN